MTFNADSSPLLLTGLLRQLRTVVAAHKWLMLALWLGIVITGMIVTLLLPPVYESTIKILVSRQRVDPRISPGAGSGDLPRPEISEEEFNSELEIFRSREVLEAIVRELRLDQPITTETSGWLAPLRRYYRSLRAQPESNPIEQACRKIAGNLEVVSVRKSRIIVATYRDSNPERAATVLNRLFQKYADHHLQLHQSPQAADVFQNEAATFRQKLEAASQALKRFDRQNGVIVAAPQKEILLRQYYEMQNLANAAKTERCELERRLAELQAQLTEQPEKIETGTVTRYVQALDKMKEELLTMELQRTQLLQKYRPESRFVRDLEQRLAQARDTIAREEQNPPQERSVALNDIHRRLTSDLLSARASLVAVQEREKRLSALTVRYRERLLEVDQKSLTRTDLERERAINEEAYVLYQKKAQEAGITKALDQSRIVNVSLAESALSASQPVSPKPLLNLAVSLLVGLLVALAGAFLAEHLNPVVRTEEQIRQRYRMKVLARLPVVTRRGAESV